MRLVDKYELARCPYGTPFYELNQCGDSYFELKEGLNILTSTALYNFEKKNRSLMVYAPYYQTSMMKKIYPAYLQKNWLIIQSLNYMK